MARVTRSKAGGSRGSGKRDPRPRRTRRLPADVRPITIELHFELDPNLETFRGQARFALRLDKRHRQIELHAADLRVSSVRALLPGQALSGRVEPHPECETIVLRFDRLLPADAVELELEFRGRVRSDLRGLYRSAATAHSAADRGEAWIATQLCPTDARRFFPCFDEPGIKARYRISVTAPRSQTVLSNAPVECERETEDGRKIVQFASTPPLSSYLIAVAVGPFEASPVLLSGATEIRVHTLPGRQPLAAFAREAAGESLDRLEQWFDMAHPYPKLDLVALPDFAFGAMENAGAVFFRDSVLLLDASEASADDRQRTAETIAHELAHMWFGNLVTMAWWNDLWLNEAFATWMAFEILDGWQPGWQIWLEFAHRRERALELDALASSHPIAPPIRTAEEAHENFDAITYTKGASVLRMLERYLGRELFRDGIRLYIRRHREHCAAAEDLWAALCEVSGEPIARIVAPWTLQTGYPLVSLRRRQEKGVGIIELHQERFLALPPAGRKGRKKPAESTRWTIPWIGGVGRDDAEGVRTLRHLLTKRRDETPSQGAGLTWIYGNADQAGFFRVEHGPSEFEDLLAGIHSLAPLERIGFIGDQWTLARAGRAPIAQLLDLIAMLATERDPDVLSALEAVLARLLRRLAAARGSLIQERLRSWIAMHFGGPLDDLGLEARHGEGERERLRRAGLFRIVGGLARTDSLLDTCHRHLVRHLETDSPLPAELGDEIVRLGARRGPGAIGEALRDATRRASTPQARRRYLIALAGLEDARSLRSSLRATLDVSLAPIPDRVLLLTTLLGQTTTAEPAWAHLQRSWGKLENEMPPILLAHVAAATAEALPVDRTAEIQQFFRAHPLAAGARVGHQIVEEMSIAKRFEDCAGEELERYLGG